MELTATAPAAATDGRVDVSVTTPQGTSAQASTDSYRYEEATPSNVRTNAIGYTHTSLVWDPPALSGITGYTIYRDTTQVVGTTDAETTNFLVANQTGTHKYSVSAQYTVGGVAKSTAQSPALSVTAPSAPTRIASCGFTAASGGDYYLNSTLRGTSAAPCITIPSSAANVTIDCRDSIIMTTANQPVIVDDGSSGFQIVNCTILQATTTTAPIDLEGVSNGTLALDRLDNTAGVPQLQVDSNTSNSSSGLVFSEDTLADVNLVANNLSNSYIGGGNFSVNASQGSPACLVCVSTGTNNTIDDNTVNGGAPQSGPNQGVDDDILLNQGVATGDTISNNTLSYTFDTGIETLGLVTNTQFINNTISNVERSALGAYYRTSWVANTMANNNASQAGSTFIIGIAPGDYLPGETNAYFDGNSFTGNVFSGNGDGESAAWLHIDHGPVPGAGPGYVDGSIDVSNNVVSTTTSAPSTPRRSSIRRRS
jgi:hypothetical protein